MKMKKLVDQKEEQKRESYYYILRRIIEWNNFDNVIMKGYRAYKFCIS